LEILLEPKTIQRGYLNERGVRRLLREHRNGIRDRSYELWHLLVFELWHRNFLEVATRVPQATSYRELSISGITTSTALAVNKSAVAEVA